MLKDPIKARHSVADKHTHSPTPATPLRRGAKEEDLLDLKAEVVFEHSDGGGVDDNNNGRAEPLTAGEERLELEHRLDVLKKLIESELKVPEKRLTCTTLCKTRTVFSYVRSVSPKVCTIAMSILQREG
ncbi:hypothetical protein V3C99_008000 [Haemonchus contortus]|uniref:Uncharacterized protein n=1 Tax=Haemonchus contortus TaxID=6289 RepID=A0A7I5EB51_HAECO